MEGDAEPRVHDCRLVITLTQLPEGTAIEIYVVFPLFSRSAIPRGSLVKSNLVLCTRRLLHAIASCAHESTLPS